MKIGFTDDPMAFLSVEDTELGRPVSVRPCDPECEGKTFLGFLLGNLPTGKFHIFEDFEGKGEDRVKVGIRVSPERNPAMWVPALRRIVWGMGSYWGRIKSEEKLREITDEDINNTWYVQALKALSKPESDTDSEPEGDESK